MYSGKILAENAVAAGQWESGKKRGFSVPAVDMRRTGKRMLPGMSESGEKGWSSRRGSWKDNYYFGTVIWISRDSSLLYRKEQMPVYDIKNNTALEGGKPRIGYARTQGT